MISVFPTPPLPWVRFCLVLLRRVYDGEPGPISVAQDKQSNHLAKILFLARTMRLSVHISNNMRYTWVILQTCIARRWYYTRVAIVPRTAVDEDMTSQAIRLFVGLISPIVSRLFDDCRFPSRRHTQRIVRCCTRRYTAAALATTYRQPPTFSIVDGGAAANGFGYLAHCGTNAQRDIKR